MMQIRERTDVQAADAVRDALGGAAALGGAHLFVSTEAGTATLYGSVLDNSQAVLAAKVALAVPGIVAVAPELVVGHRTGLSDTDIAGLAVLALRYTAHVEGIGVTVRNRVMTLTGEVDWQYQRELAYQAVRDIGDRQTVVNTVTVHTDRLVAALEAGMKSTLGVYVPPAEWNISVSGNRSGQITLCGAVTTSALRVRALEMAWTITGVTDVDAAELAVEHDGWNPTSTIAPFSTATAAGRS